MPMKPFSRPTSRSVSYTHLDVYKRQELAGLEEETGQLLEKLQQKYDKEHGKLSDRLDVYKRQINAV